MWKRYADPDYSARWSTSNAGNAATIAEQELVLDAPIRRWSPTVSTVLLVGCGRSTLLPSTLADATNIGVDLPLERARRARVGDHTAAVICGDGVALPIRSGSFGAVVLSTVFSSVLEPLIRVRLARECDRVLRAGGAVSWHDMQLPNPANRSIAPLTRRQITELFPDFEASWKSLSGLPALARRLGDAATTAYPWLARVAVVRSHHAGVLVKPT